MLDVAKALDDSHEALAAVEVEDTNVENLPRKDAIF